MVIDLLHALQQLGEKQTHRFSSRRTHSEEEGWFAIPTVRFLFLKERRKKINNKNKEQKCYFEVHQNHILL